MIFVCHFLNTITILLSSHSTSWLAYNARLPPGLGLCWVCRQTPLNDTLTQTPLSVTLLQQASHLSVLPRTVCLVCSGA